MSDRNIVQEMEAFSARASQLKKDREELMNDLRKDLGSFSEEQFDALDEDVQEELQDAFWDIKYSLGVETEGWSGGRVDLWMPSTC